MSEAKHSSSSPPHRDQDLHAELREDALPLPAGLADAAVEMAYELGHISLTQ